MLFSRASVFFLRENGPPRRVKKYMKSRLAQGSSAHEAGGPSTREIISHITGALKSHTGPT